MFKEPSVFYREYGVNQHRWKLSKSQVLRFANLYRGVCRQQFRFQRVAIKRAAIIRTQRRNVSLIVKLHIDPFMTRSGLSRQNLYFVIAYSETSVPDIAGLVISIASPLQSCRKLFLTQACAFLDDARSRVKAGVASQIAAGDLLVDQLRKSIIGIVSIDGC